MGQPVINIDDNHGSTCNKHRLQSWVNLLECVMFNICCLIYDIINKVFQPRILSPLGHWSTQSPYLQVWFITCIA